MNKLKISKIDTKAILPTRANKGDAGYDLTAISYNYVNDADVPYYNYEFGLALEIPEGYVGLICPRSSISSKDLMLTNSIGVLDSSFRGSLSARFKVTHFKGELPRIYNVGERVAQLVIVPYLRLELEEVKYNELSVTERGTGGFGSSGA